MKKILSFVLVFAFLFALMPFVLGADSTVPPVYMRPIMNSDKTNLTVEIYTDGLKWTALDLGIKFNTSALTLQSVNVGSKILTAQNRGFDFLTDHRDIAKSNTAGYCNFVAAVGSTSCSMTAYSGPVVIYTFAVKDLAKAKTGYDLCISTLVNAQGQALLNYKTFAPTAAPVVYLANGNNPFKYGDVNLDGKTSITDAMLIMQYKADMISLKEYQQYCGDVSGDKAVTVADAMLVMQLLAGMIPSFPAQG